jgi:hypothetical protein
MAREERGQAACDRGWILDLEHVGRIDVEILCVRQPGVKDRAALVEDCCAAGTEYRQHGLPEPRRFLGPERHCSSAGCSAKKVSASATAWSIAPGSARSTIGSQPGPNTPSVKTMMNPRLSPTP